MGPLVYFRLGTDKLYIIWFWVEVKQLCYPIFSNMFSFSEAWLLCRLICKYRVQSDVQSSMRRLIDLEDDYLLYIFNQQTLIAIISRLLAVLPTSGISQSLIPTCQSCSITLHGHLFPRPHQTFPFCHDVLPFPVLITHPNPALTLHRYPFPPSANSSLWRHLNPLTHTHTCPKLQSTWPVYQLYNAFSMSV